MDKFSELKAAAMAATQGDWHYSRSGFNSIVQASVTLPRGGNSRVVLCKLFRSEWRGELKTAHDAAFMAAANPAVVLALLAELEFERQNNAGVAGMVDDYETRLKAKDKCIAELERSNTSQDDHINQQQDRIESLEKTNTELGQRLGAAEKRIIELDYLRLSACEVFKEIGNELGCNPDNESIMMAIDALKDRLATPVRLPGSFYPDGGADASLAIELDEAVEAIRAAGFTVEGDEQ